MHTHEAGFLTLRWAAVYAATECAAVLAASLIFALTWQSVIACALFEGALLGLLQGWLLYGRRGRLVLNWTLATAAGVLLGRLIEYSADVLPLAGAISHMLPAVQISAGVLLGAVVGAASASFQAFQLGDRVAHPVAWVAVCGAAWGLTLPVLLVVDSAGAQFSSLPLWQGALAVVGLFAAVGAATGGIEGAALTQMLRMSDRRHAFAADDGRLRSALGQPQNLLGSRS